MRTALFGQLCGNIGASSAVFKTAPILRDPMIHYEGFGFRV